VVSRLTVVTVSSFGRQKLIENMASTGRPYPLQFVCFNNLHKKAQLSLTNPRDAKPCQELLQFDVLTKLSLTILV